jgi:hypothetical protein
VQLELAKLSQPGEPLFGIDQSNAGKVVNYCDSGLIAVSQRSMPSEMKLAQEADSMRASVTVVSHG